MLISFFYIFVFGMIFAYIFNKLKMPSLLGMMITGIIVGPHCFNFLDEKILLISSDLRQLCLIIILLRAGLSLDIKDLKKVGRPAILMSFVPALFEIVGMILIAPRVLGISVLEAGILGTVIAAVSPAVIVPKMLKLMDENYEKKHSIPQLIMAGASVDYVFVIVLFTSFIGLALGQNLDAFSFFKIPISIILGIFAGIFLGICFSSFVKKFHIRDTIKVLILLSLSFLLVYFENKMKGIITISGLLAVMTMGIVIQKNRMEVAERLSKKFSKLWVAAELILFVL